MLNKSVTSGTVSRGCLLRKEENPGHRSSQSPLGWRLGSDLHVTDLLVSTQHQSRCHLLGEGPETQGAPDSSPAHWGKPSETSVMLGSR